MKKLLVLVFVATMSMACGKKAANTTPQPDSQMEPAGEGTPTEGDPCAGAADPCAGGGADPCAGGGADPCGGGQ
jgi:hypothetical protein